MGSKNLIVMIVLILFGYSCKNKNDNCIKARVVRINCAGIVVQVLNRDSVGDYGWKDISGHTVYNNVFNVTNSCKIGKWYKGENIYFTIKDTASNNDCITCKMYDAPPRKSYEIENVSRLGCDRPIDTSSAVRRGRYSMLLRQ